MDNESVRGAAAAPRRHGPASTPGGQLSRERVLQAALDLITETGIGQLRLAEIAQRAGMSSGQVMYYFTSKEHILLETLAWQDGQDVLQVRAAVSRATGAWRQLEKFVSFYLPARPDQPAWILWLEAWARAPHNRQVDQLMEELWRPWLDELAAIVARGVQEGVFAAPAAVDDFTLRFGALLDGLAIQCLRQQHKPSRKRLIELAMTAARLELSPAGAGGP